MQPRHRRSGSWLAFAALLSATALAWSDTISLGKPFPTFEATNAANGEKFAIEDLRGRIVIIDFWATWCPPCVAELPNVKKAYDKYHEQGMEIVSISLDQSIDRCKSFIKNEKMDWMHVIEGGGWGTRLAKQYGIDSIPRMFVLDTEGVVVAEDVRGEALQAAIEKALKTTPPRLGKIAETAAANALSKAESLVSGKKYADAMKALEAVQKRYPDTEAGKTAGARLTELRESKEVAEAMKQAALEREVKQAENLLNMARSLAEAKKYDAARKRFQEVIDKFPKSEAADTAATEMAKLPK